MADWNDTSEWNAEADVNGGTDWNGTAGTDSWQEPAPADEAGDAWQEQVDVADVEEGGRENGTVKVPRFALANMKILS